MIITRRQFLKMVTASAAALGLSQTDLLRLEQVLATPQTGCSSLTPSVVWLSGQACSGCPVSLLNRVVDTGGGYYDADMLNTLYTAGLPTPGPFGNDPVGLELNVVNDVTDLVVGDAVRAVLSLASPPIVLPRSMKWADDLAGTGVLPTPTNPFPNGFITLEWSSTVMASAGDIPVQHLKTIVEAEGFVLLIDGSIPAGSATREKYCFVFDNEVNDGSGGTKIINSLPLGSITIADALRWMAPKAAAIVCVGTCSSYGGVPAARRNRTGARSVEAFLSAEGIGTPIIKVPGCPPHPDWIVYPVAYYLIHSAVPTLDSKGRPAATFGDLTFCSLGRCPNYTTMGTPDAAQFLGDDGCQAQMGCKGPLTFGDCPMRMKNTLDNGNTTQATNWCAAGSLGRSIGQARHVCQGCIEPDFPDGKSPFYEPA